MDLIEREVGQLPVSIGTSLAFEGYLGIHPNQPKQPIDTKTVKEIWVNLRTLARNLYQAVATDAISSISMPMAVELLLIETQTLPVALSQYGSKAQIRFYIASKDDIKWTFPKATFKEARTPKQMAYEVFERYVAIELLHRMKDDGIPVLEISRNPPKTDGTVAIITHYPHELLWREFFNRLVLLESHTGKIKPYNQWNSKLNTKDAQQLPFTKYTLQVFGDGVIIESQSKEIKGQLKQLAVQRKWTPIVTQDKMYHDIVTHGSVELKNNYKLLR